MANYGGMNGGNMQALMQQAQALQKEVLKAQAEFEETKITGVAANGRVKINMNGRYDVFSVYIDQDIINLKDKEMIEDLVLVALNNANEKIKKLRHENLSRFKGFM